MDLGFLQENRIGKSEQRAVEGVLGPKAQVETSGRVVDLDATSKGTHISCHRKEKQHTYNVWELAVPLVTNTYE